MKLHFILTKLPLPTSNISFWGGIIGSLILMIILVPSAPPQSVTAGVINATSAWIRWEPPPASTWNGELTGYLVSFLIIIKLLY